MAAADYWRWPVGGDDLDHSRGSGAEMRADAYPEGVKYPDTGCEVAPSCLSCPLEVCIHDSHGQAKVRLRDTRIVKMDGTDREIADTVGVSVRTVYRARKRVLA